MSGRKIQIKEGKDNKKCPNSIFMHNHQKYNKNFILPKFNLKIIFSPPNLLIPQPFFHFYVFGHGNLRDETL